MSFTLMRYKDGKLAPIKLSIWDAFKGVPPPKPRLHQCSSCNSFHRPEKKSPSEPGQAKSNGNSKISKTEKKEDGEEHSFTKEEDAKILQMKADGKTWALIATEIGGGRHKSDVSRRHKELVAKGSDAKVDDKAEKDKTNKEDEKPQVDQTNMSKKERKAAKAKQDREEGLKKREEQKTKGKVDKAKPGMTGDAKTGDSKTTTEEKNKSASKTDQIVSNGGEEKQKWITAASKHFDRTGQRITADQARKMVEEKST